MFVFRALASGSSGNAFLLRTDHVNLLFEAGLRMPALRKGLAAEGLNPDGLSAVLISHEHRDHCLSAGELADVNRLPVCANPEVLRAIGLHGDARSEALSVGRSVRFGDVEVNTFPVAHDSVCPVGFLIQTQGRVIVLATDLGGESAEVTDAVERSDLVVLEANHDREMLLRGPYPYHLRKRVAGPTGHLSNSQAANILVRHVKSDQVEVWLAHLSKQNNSPALAVKTVTRSLKAVGLGGIVVGVAERDRASLRWNGSARPRQLSLFHGMTGG